MSLNFKAPSGSNAPPINISAIPIPVEPEKLSGEQSVSSVDQVLEILETDDQLYEYIVVTPNSQSFSWRGIPEYEIERAQNFAERISAKTDEPTEALYLDSPVEVSAKDLVLARHLCSVILGHLESQLPDRVADSVSTYWKDANISKEDLKLVEKFVRRLHETWP